jgi:xylan 1,4-beta-xylosidase
LGKQAVVLKREVGGAHANPLQTWSNFGKPRSLSKEQAEILRASAEPLQTDEKLFAQNGVFETKLTVPVNHLCLLEIMPVEDQTDTYVGYDPAEFYGLK